MRMDYDGGNIEIGEDSNASGCTNVALPAMPILGIRIDHGWYVDSIRFRYEATADVNIDLLLQGAQTMGHIPTISESSSANYGYKLFVASNNNEMDVASFIN